jgi:aminobenzoyl-glutamate utilization protein B
LPLIRDFIAGGSTDVADVSWKVPVAIFGWPTHPLGVSAPTWAVTACGGMSIGDKASLASAEIMTSIGLELLTEPKPLQSAKAELKERLAGRSYKAVLKIDLTKSISTAVQGCKGQGEEYVSGLDAK